MKNKYDIILPLDVIDIILEYAGKIKNRNGKLMNQIYLQDKKYISVIQTIYEKINRNNQISINSDDAFCLHSSLNNSLYGITHWSDFNMNIFAFYKNPSIATKYSFLDVYNKFLKIYINELPISIYEY